MGRTMKGWKRFRGEKNKGGQNRAGGQKKGGRKNHVWACFSTDLMPVRGVGRVPVWFGQKGLELCCWPLGPCGLWSA